MYRSVLFQAAIAGMLAVVMGAFGAHALQHMLSERMIAVYHTAVDYHFWHALGLGLIALILQRQPGSACLRHAAKFMLAGIILFSGSLYALCLSGISWLGMITPLGGISFILGWLLLAIHAFKYES